MRYRICAAIALSMTLLVAAFCQVFTSNITGSVADPSGNFISNAEVVVKNEATGEIRRTTTDATGRYTVSQLPPGSYELTVSAAGFKKFVKSQITLDPGQTGEQDANLTLGDVTQSVEVSANVEALDTQTANKNVMFNESQMVGLPAIERNPLLFVHDTAGVVAVRQGQEPYMTDQNTNRFALNGGRDESAAILVDGVSIVSPGWGGAIAVPSQDAVAETQVTRQAYDAQYGRTDGGVVSLVTKSGTNQFHGSAFEFLRNNDLDANSWSANFSGIPRQPFHRNQFGANLGGPIWKSKKLFFFSAFEAFKQGSPTTQISSVPTSLQRGGNFSQTYNSDGSLAVIFDPNSTTSASNGNYVRTPFPNNTIPSNRFDPVGAKALDLYPDPNTAGDAITNANNFAGAGQLVSNYYKLDSRIDWVKSEKYSLFGRVTKGWEEDGIPLYFKNGADNTGGEKDPRFEIVLGQTYVPDPTWVVNVLIGSGRWHEIDTTASQQYSGTLVGFPASLVDAWAINTFPQFNVSGYDQLGNAEFTSTARESENGQVNVSKEKGSHSIKFGFMVELQFLNSLDETSAMFNFDRGLTSGPVASTNATDSGNSLASLLLGAGASGNAPYNAALALAQRYYAWYVQDSWKATRRLTFTAGLRYEIQTPRTERYNRLNYFSTGVVSPLAAQTGLNLVGGLEFDGSSQRGWWNPDYTNFAPRVSLAYKITDKLVFRSGFAIFDSPAAATQILGTSDGFSTNTTWVSTVGGNGIIPLNPLSNPYPQGINQPLGSSQGLLTDIGQTVNAFQREHPTPYVETYSADFQYMLTPSSVLEVGYTGTQGRKLLMGATRNINQLDPSYLSLGSALNNNVANPFYNIITNGPLSGPTIPYWRLLVPYPQFQAVSLEGDTPGASSSYNALLVKFSHRFSNSVQLMATYAWSKALDDTSETQAWEINDNLRNAYNISEDRSISAHDLPQDFVANAIVDLPVGKGRRFGNSMNRAADAIIGGWQLAAVGRVGSGLPLQFYAPNDLSTYGFAVLRPDITSMSALTNVNQNPNNWFNIAAVVDPAPYTIGDAPRFVGAVRRRGDRQLDLGLNKSFTLKEGLRLQIRGEAYNLTNTPQYGGADTTLGDGGFGKVTGTTNIGPRNIQLGARLDF
ncbi:MAG TPA: TonB-dependent receptor [Bryobacteraceae bacterium]|nr:TonB-dependent receptor [Bryobacteraceae bacterium]